MQGDEADDGYMGDLSQFLPPDEIARLQAKEKESENIGYKGKLKRKERRKLTKEDQQKKEFEQLKRGFNSAIPSTNIGFKMLQQMGYSPGVALGKNGQGMIEPVKIDIKRSRTGLGLDNMVKEKQIEKAKEMERIAQKRKLNEIKMMSEFEERNNLLWRCKKIVTNYKKAKAALSQLEEAKYGKGYESEQDAEDTVEEEEEEEKVTAQELQEVLDRLRTEFHYCLYCGCQYESVDALLSNCPGTEEEDH
ncbi:uncharacterized protein LOC131076611 [Cryptomeria japonica]|uniref:uncharacterized protein LOC131076611 n=1 Tax=Cryptomeria japonica TaxID=3369 RepID=UPI0027D9EF92|nr:uncharacterized protein LOC131076611 [Cryptomeria japonica]XP_057869865.2 uncharacterized protein LOC131076611 [Cryptomeria japonica]